MDSKEIKDFVKENTYKVKEIPQKESSCFNFSNEQVMFLSDVMKLTNQLMSKDQSKLKSTEGDGLERIPFSYMNTFWIYRELVGELGIGSKEFREQQINILPSQILDLRVQKIYFPTPNDLDEEKRTKENLNEEERRNLKNLIRTVEFSKFLPANPSEEVKGLPIWLYQEMANTFEVSEAEFRAHNENMIEEECEDLIRRIYHETKVESVENRESPALTPMKVRKEWRRQILKIEPFKTILK